MVRSTNNKDNLNTEENGLKVTLSTSATNRSRQTTFRVLIVFSSLRKTFVMLHTLLPAPSECVREFLCVYSWVWLVGMGSALKETRLSKPLHTFHCVWRLRDGAFMSGRLCLGGSLLSCWPALPHPHDERAATPTTPWQSSASIGYDSKLILWNCWCREIQRDCWTNMNLLIKHSGETLY